MSERLITHSFEVNAVTVNATLTTILTILPSDVAAIGSSIQLDALHGLIQFEVVNNAAQPLTDFRIEQQDHASGAWYPYMGIGDWVVASTNSKLLSTDQTMNALPASASGHAAVSLYAPTAIRFMALRGATVTNIDIRGTLLVSTVL